MSLPSPAAVGQATIWGLDRTIVATGFVMIPSSLKVTHKTTKQEVKDGQGYTCQKSYVDDTLEMELDFRPSGATRAIAKAYTFVMPGSTVVLSGITTGPQGAAPATGPYFGLNDNWTYDGEGTIELKPGDNGTATLKLVKYVDVVQNAAMIVAVT